MFKLAKKVPTTTWSSDNPMSMRPKLKTLVILIIGLWIFGTGDAIIIAAGLGVAKRKNQGPDRTDAPRE